MKLLQEKKVLVEIVATEEKGFLTSGKGVVLNTSPDVNEIKIGDEIVFTKGGAIYEPGTNNVFIITDAIISVNRKNDENCPYSVRYVNQIICLLVEKKTESNNYFATIEVVKSSKECSEVNVGDKFLVKDYITLPDSRYVLIYDKDIWLRVTK